MQPGGGIPSVGVLWGLFSVLTLAVPAAAQPEADSAQAYRIYRGDGTAATLADLVTAVGRHDVVFFGEVHDDPTAHEIQLKLLQEAHQQYGTGADSAQGRLVRLSMEMFERDVQPVLEEYLQGWITEDHFLRSSRPWDKYRSAYRSLVEFAKAHDLAVLAANAPRRYVNRVSRKGAASLKELPPSAKQWLPPLPYAEPSPAYRAKWMRKMESTIASPDSSAPPHQSATPDTTSHGAGQTAPHGHAEAMAHLLQAQALWDATMAYSIAQHLTRHPAALVLHVVGAFHVSGGTGLPEHLARYRPGTRILTVVIQPTDHPSAFEAEEHGGRGDFVILTEASRVPQSEDNRF